MILPAPQHSLMRRNRNAPYAQFVLIQSGKRLRNHSNAGLPQMIALPECLA
jgi:hypothetical protein